MLYGSVEMIRWGGNDHHHCTQEIAMLPFSPESAKNPHRHAEWERGIIVFFWLCWVLWYAESSLSQARSLVVACGIFFLFFSSGSMQTLSCGMWNLVPWPGIEPWPPAVGLCSLSHWGTTTEVPYCLLCVYYFLIAVLRITTTLVT